MTIEKALSILDIPSLEGLTMKSLTEASIKIRRTSPNLEATLISQANMVLKAYIRDNNSTKKEKDIEYESPVRKFIEQIKTKRPKVLYENKTIIDREIVQINNPNRAKGNVLKINNENFYIPNVEYVIVPMATVFYYIDGDKAWKIQFK